MTNASETGAPGAPDDEVCILATPYGGYLTTRVERFLLGVRALGQSEDDAWVAAWDGAPPRGSGADAVTSAIHRLQSALSCEQLLRRLSAAEIRYLKGV